MKPWMKPRKGIPPRAMPMTALSVYNGQILLSPGIRCGTFDLTRSFLGL